MLMSNNSENLPKLSSKKIFQAWYIPEPLLIFGNGKTHIDPKIGLALYGPLKIGDAGKTSPTSIKVGVIGTGETIGLANRFLDSLMQVIPGSNTNPFLYPPFPGFQDAFDCTLTKSESFNEIITTHEINTALNEQTFEAMVNNTVNLFLDKIENISERVPKPDVVLCALPQDVVDKCAVKKTRSGEIKKPKTKRGELIETLKEHIQNKQTFLDDFEEHALEIIEKGEDLESSNFWRALKAGAMRFGMPTQIAWPNTLATKNDAQQRQDDSTIAWNFSVALHYKGSGFPWTMTRMKRGTCYVGVSFFKDLTDESKRMRTSMAQIFTYTGEGLVLRGDKFEWDANNDRSPHLDKSGAKKLLNKAIELYTKRIGQPPERVVVHKSSRYWDDEKEGFEEALKDVKYHDLIAFGERDIRFFRYGKFPPLRGSVIQLGKGNHLLYTRGFSPYLRTYPGAHVPLPLEILEHYGESPADTILTEILALSKMNWNSADFSLAKPITLLFSKRVGEVMATLSEDVDPKHEYLYYM